MSVNILLIEDENFIRDLYKRQLDLGGMPTDAFATGTEGLQALSQKKYDLILLDVMLPDMNGLQVLRSIKQDIATKDIPVVLLTNLTKDLIIEQGLKEGAISYLLKAVLLPKQILKEVKEILNQISENTSV